MTRQLSKQTILGVGITNTTEEDILQYILTSLEKKRDPYYIVTPNPEIIVFATSHKAYRTVLNAAEIALPDGVGVMIAAKVLGKPLQERVAGVDVMELLCKEVATPLRPSSSAGQGKPITVGFLGGRDGVAERTAECLTRKYPGLQVSFIGEEWDESKAQSANLPAGKAGRLAQRIDILFVAFGFPKQEEFMSEHIGKIPVRVMMGVGGAFDYISGRVPRAPKIVQAIGLEWLFRLLVEPWRWKRQLALFSFAYLIFREKIFH